MGGRERKRHVGNNSEKGSNLKSTEPTLLLLLLLLRHCLLPTNPLLPCRAFSLLPTGLFHDPKRVSYRGATGRTVTVEVVPLPDIIYMPR